MADEVRSKCTHVIFDMDGLLLDTERIYSEITSTVFSEYGVTFDLTFKAKIMGMPKQAASQLLVQEFKLPITADEYLTKAEALKTKLFPSAKLLPGADKLVRHLHACNIPIAVATGSATFEFDLKVTHHKEFFSLFDHILKSDDPAVKKGKPHPDIFQVAASRFKTQPKSPDQVLVFEDAPNGVQSAKAAGMQVVMVPEVYIDRTLCSTANQVLGSLKDFDPAEWGLPSF